MRNMETMNNTLDLKELYDKVAEFLQMKNSKVFNGDLNENIKEVCVAKLCNAIGLRCSYNYKSDFFNFFSTIMGEAICQKLNLPLHIAGANLRFVRYDHFNLVDYVKMFLDQDDMDEAFIDAFNFVDRYRYLIPQILDA